MTPGYIAQKEAEAKLLDYNGDNSDFVLDMILHLGLSDDDIQVMRWAYGRDGSDRSYEKESDGETVVKDKFLGGKIKSPMGVTHDYVNRVEGHMTPDGHVWTRSECNALYRRIMKAFGYGIFAYIRWTGVTVTGWIPFISWWR